MQYHKIHEENILDLKRIVGEENVIVNYADLKQYAKDYTEDLEFFPDLVLLPINAIQVSQILAYCNQNNIAITPRGAGTGLSGASLAVQGGISLGMQKMNQIIEIDTNNFQARIQPGVVNAELRQRVEDLGLFYPPDPASLGSCFLGGNVAHSSGGPRAVKYGTTKDYILNLQIALPSGELIWTGANTLKNSTGYNLTQLMVGSEGTLGIITEIVVKLVAKPKHTVLLWSSFANAEDACRFVPNLLLQGIVPSALEFMELSAVQIAMQASGLSVKTDGAQAFVLIELDGEELEQLYVQSEKVYEVLEQFGVLETEFADTAEQKEKLWKIRRSMGEAVKQKSIYKEEDTVVPRYYLPELYKKIKELEAEYGFESVCYGHAGDGNLHVNILKNNMSKEKWETEIPKAIRKLFETCKDLGGTISGEHGIGLVQKPYLDVVFQPIHFEIMKGIKKVFDPKGILNPGKWVG